jgi:hypothetical protein
VRRADGLEGAVGALAGVVQRRRMEGERARRGELAGENRQALLARLRIPLDQLPDRVVVGVGVLAHVERREMQAEGGERAHRPLEAPARDQLPAVGQERLAHQLELRQQLGRADVVAARLARPAGGEPPARVHELLLDAGELQAVGLLRVQAQEARLDLRQQLEIVRQRRLELRRRAGYQHR